MSTASAAVMTTAAVLLLALAALPVLAGLPPEQAMPAIAAAAVPVAAATAGCLALMAATRHLNRKMKDLAGREELLSAAQRVGKLGFWHYDPASGRFGLSRHLHEALGGALEPLDLSRRQLLDMMHPEDGERLLAALERLVADGGSEQGEYRFTGPDGVRRTLGMSARRMPGSDGRAIRLHGVCQDITEQKAIEAALRESEDHYRHALELSVQIPWTADPDGNILEGGPRWVTLTGMPIEEALGFRWTQALHPDDVAPTLRDWSACLASGEPVDIEYRLRLASGEHRWFRSQAAARRCEKGGILRWYGTVEDIHDRKMAEASLRESEMRFRAMADGAPVAIWVTDPCGASIFHSRLWYDVTGQTEEETLGDGWMTVVHPEDIARVNESFLASNGRRESFRIEYRLRRADGGWEWVIDVGQPRFAPDGSFLGFTGSVLPITERRTAEMALRDSEAFARSILDSSTDGVKVLDLDGHLLFMNAPGLGIMEVDDFERLRDRDWAGLWPGETGPRIREAVETARAGGVTRFVAFSSTLKGTPKWWDVTVSPIPGADGRPERLLATSRDITSIKAAQDEVERARRMAEEAARRLGSVLESTSDGVVTLDRDWRLTFLNPRAAEMIAGNRDLLGASLWSVFPETVGTGFERAQRNALARQEPVEFEDFIPSLGKWLEVRSHPTAEGLSIFFRDVSDRRRSQEQLLHMARHDALTGLPNRLLLRECLDRTLARSDGAQTAVLFLDLDEFKAVNDTLGHPAGDRILGTVAERLRACTGGGDVVARFGGDEFAVMQTGLTEPEEAAALARRIIAALSEPYPIDGRRIALSVSIGIALASAAGVPAGLAKLDGAAADHLLKNADIALYRAKADGRRIHRFFEPGMADRLQEHQRLKDDLRGALDRGEFSLRYQPLVSLKSLQVHGFEALLRWNHPARGLVSPADFIPMAEETGEILEIGRWVLHQACHEAVSWPEGISVAVNLSPVQFRGDGLVTTVSDALAASLLRADRLQLEITESVLLQDSEVNLAVLHALRDLGVGISMDDFGTGYSSLSYLRSFPFDKIKIDRAFIGDLPDGAESKAIVRAVVGLGHSLGIATTAEGVETREQLQALRNKGCQEGQGYLFSRPVSAADVPDVIERLRRLADATAANAWVAAG